MHKIQKGNVPNAVYIINMAAQLEKDNFQINILFLSMRLVFLFQKANEVGMVAQHL